MNLIYLYSYAYDSNDLDGWLSLFRGNAIWSDYWGNSSVPDMVTRSSEECRQPIGPHLEKMKAQGIQSGHYMTNTLLNKTDEGCKGHHDVLTGLAVSLESQPTPEQYGLLPG